MRGFILTAILCLLLAACAQYKPMEVRAIDDIPEGPGVLSGEDGEFVFFNR